MVSMAGNRRNSAAINLTPNDSCLRSRFVVNVPDVELTAERICFQVEQAHWFYEDFVRMIQPRLPSFQLKTFSSRNILFFFSLSD